MMKLYELKRDTYFTLSEVEDCRIFLFDHLDGMYSVCFNEDMQVVHISAYADVIIVNKEK